MFSSHVLLNGLRKTQTNLGFNVVLGANKRIKVLPSILYDAQSKGYELHICALDLSEAFDSIYHAPVWHSLTEY